MATVYLTQFTGSVLPGHFGIIGRRGSGRTRLAKMMLNAMQYDFLVILSEDAYIVDFLKYLVVKEDKIPDVIRFLQKNNLTCAVWIDTVYTKVWSRQVIDLVERAKYSIFVTEYSRAPQASKTPLVVTPGWKIDTWLAGRPYHGWDAVQDLNFYQPESKWILQALPEFMFMTANHQYTQTMENDQHLVLPPKTKTFVEYAKKYAKKYAEDKMD